MQNSNHQDLSDEEFELVLSQFQQLLPKYGTLWRMKWEVHKRDLNNDGTEQIDNKQNQESIVEVACSDDCCKPMIGFVPDEYLNSNVHPSSSTMPTSTSNDLKPEIKFDSSNDTDEKYFSANSVGSAVKETIVEADRVVNTGRKTAVIDEDLLDEMLADEFDNVNDNVPVEVILPMHQTNVSHLEISVDDAEYESDQSTHTPIDNDARQYRNTDNSDASSSESSDGSTVGSVCDDAVNKSDTVHSVNDDSESGSSSSEGSSVVNFDHVFDNLYIGNKNAAKSSLSNQSVPSSEDKSALLESTPMTKQSKQHDTSYDVRRSRDSILSDVSNVSLQRGDDKLGSVASAQIIQVDSDSDSEESLSTSSQRNVDESKVMSVSSDDEENEFDDDNFIDNDSVSASDISGTEQQANRESTSNAAAIRRFVRERGDLSVALFKQYDRVVFDGQLGGLTTVEWSKKLRTTAGLTRLVRQNGGGRPASRLAKIELSTKILDSRERLCATLMHEMCHAGAWIVDGVSKPPHGKEFKYWAKLAMRRVPSIKVTTTHDYIIERKYAWACQECKQVYKRDSRSIKPGEHVCGKCKGRLEEIDAKQLRNNGQVRKREVAGPSAYNLFVKDVAPKIRARLTKESGSCNNADVMKECGRLWRLQKSVE